MYIFRSSLISKLLKTAVLPKATFSFCAASAGTSDKSESASDRAKAAAKTKKSIFLLNIFTIKKSSLIIFIFVRDITERYL